MIEVMVVGTAGVEVQPLVGEMPVPVHVVQALAPVACGCGKVHAFDDPAELRLVVGPKVPRPPPPGRWLTVGIAPPRAEPAPWPQVVAHRPRDFRPWARDAIAHVISGLLGDGLVDLDPADVRALFDGATRLRLLEADGPGLWDATNALVHDPDFVPSPSAWLHMTADREEWQMHIEDGTERVEHALGRTRMLLSAAIDIGRPRASLLVALPEGVS